MKLSSTSALFAGCVLSISAATLVVANPVFDGHTLHIPAVEIEGQPGAYQQIEMQPVGDDLWRLNSIREGVKLRHINNVSLVVTETAPVQVFLKVQGNYMSGCDALGEVTERYDASSKTLHVFMYYRLLREPEDGLILCTGDIRAFEIVRPLPVYAAAAGDYKVILNDQYELEFSLGRRNVLD